MSIWVKYEVITKIWNHNPPTSPPNLGGRECRYRRLENPGIAKIEKIAEKVHSCLISSYNCSWFLIITEVLRHSRPRVLACLILSFARSPHFFTTFFSPHFHICRICGNFATTAFLLGPSFCMYVRISQYLNDMTTRLKSYIIVQKDLALTDQQIWTI